MLPRSLLSLQRRPQRTRKMHMPYFWFVPVDNHRRRGSVVRIIIQSEGNKRDGRPLNPPPHSRVRIISHASSSSPSLLCVEPLSNRTSHRRPQTSPQTSMRIPCQEFHSLRSNGLSGTNSQKSAPWFILQRRLSRVLFRICAQLAPVGNTLFRICA